MSYLNNCLVYQASYCCKRWVVHIWYQLFCLHNCLLTKTKHVAIIRVVDLIFQIPNVLLCVSHILLAYIKIVLTRSSQLLKMNVTRDNPWKTETGTDDSRCFRSEDPPFQFVAERWIVLALLALKVL